MEKRKNNCFFEVPTGQYSGGAAVGPSKLRGSVAPGLLGRERGFLRSGGGFVDSSSRSVGCWKGV